MPILVVTLVDVCITSLYMYLSHLCICMYHIFVLIMNCVVYVCICIYHISFLKMNHVINLLLLKTEGSAFLFAAPARCFENMTLVARRGKHPPGFSAIILGFFFYRSTGSTAQSCVETPKLQITKYTCA